jgi:cell division protein FtsB
MLPTDHYNYPPTPNPSSPTPPSRTLPSPRASTPAASSSHALSPNASYDSASADRLTSSTPEASARRRDLRVDDDYVDRGAALSRLPKLPFEAFLVVLMGAILLLVVFLNGRSSLNDARQDRDSAIAEVDALTERTTAAEQGLDAAEKKNVELAAQISELENAALTPVDAPNGDDVSTLQDELIARDETIAELETANADLATANETLGARIDELGSADIIAADPNSGPAFELFLGELLASENGVRINQLQSVCLSRFVIDDIGLDAIGSGLSTAQNTATNDLLIQSMVGAATACSIDPSLIF